MAENKMLIYLAVVIVAVAAFVAAAYLVGGLTPQTNKISLSLASNSSGTIYPYQTTGFNVVVTNTGSRAIIGLPVAFYVNGVEKNYNTYTIQSHHTVIIEDNYTYRSGGIYLFSAVADPGNVLGLSGPSKSSMTVNVIAPMANIFESVPNNNITYTDSFSTTGSGLFSASLLGRLYNISAVQGMNSGDGGIISKAYIDYYQYIAVANGAFTIYTNNSISYTSWLQGTVNPDSIAYVVSSFGKNVSKSTSSYGTAYYAKLNNRTSFCTYYQNGWTKIIEYYNDSRAGSCKGIISRNYTPTESNVLVEELKSSGTANTLAKFNYLNSTSLGQTIQSANGTFALSNLFQLTKPAGLFLSTIEKYQVNISRVNTTCFGLVATVNNVNVCSVVMNPIAGSNALNSSFSTIFSKYVNPNYTLELYSFVNETNLIPAHENALKLISLLEANEVSVNWTTPYHNGCGFVSNSIACAFRSFSNANNTATITLTNSGYSSIRLSNITCSQGSALSATQLNGTLAMGNSITISTYCSTLPVPTGGLATLYRLSLNFKYGSVPLELNGTLNVTNLG